MLSCEKCVESLYPDDPRVRSIRTNICGCDYCDKPQYLRVVNQPEPEIPDTIEIKQLKYQVEQAKAGYIHLQNKLNEHLDKSKSKDIL